VRGYVARCSWFTDDAADALAAKLGLISKFQSLNSEDAVTWSWFGTLALADAETRRRALQWLYDELRLALRASASLRIEQWPRVMHPNAPESPHGPELDALIDDPGGALVYVEAKWEAVLGTGKGATEGIRDDQVVLRRDSFRSDLARVADGRVFIVLGVSNAKPDLTAYEEKADRQQPTRPDRVDDLVRPRALRRPSARGRVPPLPRLETQLRNDGSNLGTKSPL
jgi:hypothetical protein